MKHIAGVACAAAFGVLIWFAAPAVDAQRGAQNPEFLADPGNPDQGLALTKHSGASAVSTFARARGAGVPAGGRQSARASERALTFLASHGNAFGLERASDVRLLRETAPDETGVEHVRFQQLHQGVPVTAGQLIVHLRRDHVVAANSEVLSELPADVLPDLLSAEATVKARELMARQRDAATAAELTYSEPRLEVFNRGLLQDGSFPTRLAWFIEASALAVREFIWVDARSGAILLHFDQLTPARNRRIYTANNGSVLPGVQVRVEGGAPTGDPDADLAYDYAGDTYNYFFTQHGRDSFDNAGGTLISTVRYCPDIFNCPYANAFWNGTQMVYGQGLSTADDVDAHELTHAVTERSAGLFYYMQSGALNESFSDIFGETVDLTNARGNDTAAVRWKLGEDLPASIGVIRDMANPQALGDPGKTSDPEFKCDYSSDGGGVHSNSGVPNHAYALMVDGGTYNGRTISAIGLTAAAKIHYRALTTYLTSGSNFIDHYNAVQQSCSDLVGVSGITSATCVQVKAALDAVQMNGAFCGNSAAPALCSSGQTATTLFADTFESASNTNWSRTALQGTGLWSVPDTGWAKSGTRMAYGEDFGSPTDTVLSMVNGVTLPAGAKLQFSHAYAFEQGLEAYDGGVVEYSTNGGASWIDAGSLIAAGDPYDVTPISSCCTNPLGGRRGFVGNSFGYTASQLNLGALAGSTVRFRFRIGTDAEVGDLGWVVDDFRLYTCGSSCSFSITPAAQAFAAAGGAGSVAVSASGATCAWTAASSVPWITLGGSSGSGSSTVAYTVAANTGAARSGTISIAGKTFTVTQAASSSATVTVTAPNGGERLYAGTPYTIQWTGSGAAKFDVSSSTDGGATYVAVPGCTGLAGTARSCTWAAPGPQTTNGRIKVTASDSAGVATADVSNAAFSIASGAGAITVTYPNTAVNVGIGSLQVIRWAHNLGAQSFVKIQLSRDGGLTYPVTLVNAHKNSGATSGSYNWRVTGAATTGAQARIRITWTNGPTTDTSNVNFTIAPAFITLTAPAVGTNWGFTTTQKQVWSTNLGEGDRVNVQLSTAGSTGVYTTMSGGANVIASKKTANVVVPSTATAAARLKVVWANPPSGFSATANNPGNFIIQAPFISITAPAAGALWQIGTAKALTWKSNLGVLENVAIHLSKDGGVTFPIAMATSTPSDGTQTFTVNAAWGSQTTTRIRLTWVRTPTLRGTSANFTIQP
jgi:Zn-dependent metalloprotease